MEAPEKFLEKGIRSSVTSLRDSYSLNMLFVVLYMMVIALFPSLLVLTGATTSVFSLSGDDASLNSFPLFSSDTPVFSTNQLPGQFELDQNQQQQSGIPGGFKTYQDPLYGISISYPSSWVPSEIHNTYENDITGIIAFQPAPGISIGAYVEDPYEAGQSLDEFSEDMLNDYEDSFDDFEVIERFTDSSLGGVPANSLVWSGVIEGSNNISFQTETMMGNKVYTIEYAADDASSYATYLPVAKQIMDSFKFTGTMSQPLPDSNNVPSTPPPSQQPPSADNQGDDDVGFGGTPVNPDEDNSAKAPAKPKF